MNCEILLLFVDSIWKLLDEEKKLWVHSYLKIRSKCFCMEFAVVMYIFNRISLVKIPKVLNTAEYEMEREVELLHIVSKYASLAHIADNFENSFNYHYDQRMFGFKNCWIISLTFCQTQPKFTWSCAVGKGEFFQAT